MSSVILFIGHPGVLKALFVRFWEFCLLVARDLGAKGVSKKFRKAFAFKNVRKDAPPTKHDLSDSSMAMLDTPNIR